VFGEGYEEVLAAVAVLLLGGPRELVPTHTGHRVASVSLRQCDVAVGTEHDTVVQARGVLHAGLSIVIVLDLASKAVYLAAAQGDYSGVVSEVPQMQVGSPLWVMHQLQYMDEHLPCGLVAQTHQIHEVSLS